VERALQRDRRGGDPGNRHLACRLAQQTHGVELADLLREIGCGRVDLLEQVLRGEVHHELAGGLHVVQRVLAPHRGELHDRRSDAGDGEE
jgi:hypothetical protein